MAMAAASSGPTAASTASSTPSGDRISLSIFFGRPTSLAHASISLHALATASLQRRKLNLKAGFESGLSQFRFKR